MQGVFPPGTDGSHVNAVDRSKSGQLIVTGDDWGLVSLYRNPCLNVIDHEILRVAKPTHIEGIPPTS